ncbi:MAG: phosphodiester glycosidase family protein [Cyanobacteria bacterium]|nr:phosphodiester glycosidase family protein [Cyanobacteriota bacterium]
MAALPSLLRLLAMGPLLAALPNAPPPLPAAPVLGPPGASRLSPAPGLGQAPAPGASLQGGLIEINGLRQTARWLRAPAGPGQAEPELWLPLEVLQGQLGMTSQSRPDGSLRLEWFGTSLELPPGSQRSLEDEVALPVGRLLQAAGARLTPQGNLLRIEMAPVPLLAVRTRELGTGRRVVLDLGAAALLYRADRQLVLAVSSSAEQRLSLEALGLRAQQGPDGLRLTPPSDAPPHLLTLGSPARLVLDFGDSGIAPNPSAEAGAGGTVLPVPSFDPRLKALIGHGIELDRSVSQVDGEPMLINSVRLDPRTTALDLRPLTRAGGMEGLSTLSQLAQGEQALIAINGGYFNRVKRLPLGALRDGGTWLSGPILNRGAIGWGTSGLPSFGRLALQEWISDGQGQRLAVLGLNSGYVQRGLSRYTPSWGRTYHALSNGESGLVLQDKLVVQQLGAEAMAAGVPLDPGTMLLVARGDTQLPWGTGSQLSLTSQPTDPLGLQPFVLGGGPLLLQDGQVVLNGASEGFSPGFLSQGAPRTVVGSDGQKLWLVTIQGVGNLGPTLLQTAQTLQRLGLRDALNLDGGSSTGLLLGGVQSVKGRGVVAAVHNGLGLIPRPGGPLANP